VTTGAARPASAPRTPAPASAPARPARKARRERAVSTTYRLAPTAGPTSDDRSAFAHAAASEREQIFGHADLADGAVDRMRSLLNAWLHRDRDSVSLLWLDAWQASRRRPALLAEVGRQMNTDLDRLSAVIAGGIAAGDFEIEDPGAPALQMLSLIDGLSVQAATRGILDYTPVRAMVIATTERLLALPPGALTQKSF
jgi:hypothetical protein